MPLMQTSGNVTADAYAGGAAAKVNYIEDCFVTWLSTGNGTSRTVTGPDMTAGGLSITKSRSAATGWHWVDTARGAGLSLSSNTTSAQATESTGVTAFTTTGTSIGSAAEYNTNGATYVDYLLKKQPKFSDVVTYTGTGSPQTIAHNLGSAPRFMLVKRTDTTGNWCAYHSDLGATQIMFLNTTAAATTNTTYWNSTNPNTTVFSVGTNAAVNASGGTYVAYLFASNAGGFGLTGTDNVITCGSFTTDASGNATVNLGYEPQWVLWKPSSTADAWVITDNMRGLTVGGNDQLLYPNLSNAEASGDVMDINALGFSVKNQQLSSTYIYIAIRRGPMKVPTDGTKVFSAITNSDTTGTVETTGFPIDLQFTSVRDNGIYAGFQWLDRLRGISSNSTELSFNIASYGTFPESQSSYARNWNNTGFSIPSPISGFLNIFYSLRRAPGFFDEVCYTGTGTNQTQNHNLGVVPEFIIIKDRNVGNWFTYSNMTASSFDRMFLNSNDWVSNLSYTSTSGFTAKPTATSLFLDSYAGTNNNNDPFVAYLFASCAGVSKIGRYTGNGTTQTINCGFTGGARFVLIKRTSSPGGDWYVYDTARGMTTLTDPYLLLNSTAAESATLGSVTSVTTGFAVNASILSAINTNGASYIYLSIA